jgi:hypothetical protein
LSDAAWAKPSPRAVRSASVKWSACGPRISICVSLAIEQYLEPRKAISNFSLSLAKHGKYGRRPKVEMPEKTESA